MIRPIAAFAALAALAAQLPAPAQAETFYCNGQLVADHFYHAFTNTSPPLFEYFVRLRNTTQSTLRFRLTLNAPQISQSRTISMPIFISAGRSMAVPLGVDPASAQSAPGRSNWRGLDLRPATVITCY